MKHINSKDISVVVQGAIDRKCTAKCLKSIRKHLPDAEIILSTWEGSNVSGLEYDVLVENKDPKGIKHDFAIYNKANSINNFNRQLVSTQNGIAKATRRYILKFRSDLELKNVNFITFWDDFCVRKDKFSLFNHKVLCSSLYSRVYSCTLTGNGLPTPFHPSDFWFFGLADDLKSYFSASSLLSEKEAGNWEFKYPNRLPYSTMLWRYAPEQCFCINWVRQYFPDIEFDDWSDWNSTVIELSKNVLYNNFIFLDYEQSGIYSKKHRWAFENVDKIQGLISFKYFKTQYKKYCDASYVIDCDKNYVSKIKKHMKRFVAPVKFLVNWLMQPFSIFYYFCLLGIMKLRGLFK